MSFERPPQWAVDRVDAHQPFFWADWNLMIEKIDEQGVITSYWRSLEENERVGGQPSSQHLIGTAVDIVPFEIGNWDNIQHIAASFGYKVIREVQNGNSWLHIQAFPLGMGPSRVQPRFAGEIRIEPPPRRDPRKVPPSLGPTVIRNGIPGWCDQCGTWRPF